MRPGDGLTSFNIDSSAKVLVKKKFNEAFRRVYYLRTLEKTLGQINNIETTKKETIGLTSEKKKRQLCTSSTLFLAHFFPLFCTTAI